MCHRLGDQMMVENSFWLDNSTKIFEPKNFKLENSARQLMLSKESMLWLSTSGSTGKPNWFGISKEGYLKAASSICKYFGVTDKDRWCLCLPTSHVGGLSVLARSFVSRCGVDNFGCAWNPESCWNYIEQQQSTIVSLVPTQLHDLVNLKLSPPKSLRLALIGGAALDQQLYNASVKLGWPILSSYGLTEASALLAAQPLDNLKTGQRSPLQVLGHIEVRATSEGQLEIRGDSVAKAKLKPSGKNRYEIVDPTTSGWFLTNDLVEIETTSSKKTLFFQARVDRNVKINGELVSLTDLELKIKEILAGELEKLPLVVIGAKPDPRSGHRLVLFLEGGEANLDLTSLNMKLLGLERLSEMRLVNHFPRLDSGKIDFRAVFKITE